MTISGPWYVTTSAVLDYARLTGRPIGEDDRPALDRLAVELERLCTETEARYRAAGRAPGVQRSGARRYHTGRAHGRIVLVVSADPRPEGDRPALVAVVARSVAPGGAR